MSRPTKLLPLLAFMLVCSVVAAQAIDWTSPTYPFYGAEGTGPIYFSSSFEATNGSITGGLLRFSGFNYASSGDFGTWGIGAEAGLTVTVLEMAPATYLLIQTSTVAPKNVTMWFPDLYVVNCTSASAWGWDNATKLLEVTAPAGGAQIRVNFVAGSGSLIFIVPEWFIDQGGVFFGVADFFTNLSNVMTAFVAWFLSSVGYIVSLIFYIMTGIVSIAVFVITWFGRGINFMITLFTAVGNVFDTANTTVAPYAEVVNLLFSADGMMLCFVIGFASWFGSLPIRANRSGSGMAGVLTGDVQTAMYWVDLVWGWSWTVFNFVYGVIMQFVSLLWGLIP